MKTIFNIIIVFFLLLNKNINAQSSQPIFQWTKQAGEDQFDYLYCIAIDNTGNVNVVGKIGMDTNFGDSTWVQCAGIYDIFIAK